MIQRLIEEIREKLRNQKGAASMYFIIFMLFFFPFALWVGVYLPAKVEATYNIKQMVSNVADSGITFLDQDDLMNGQIKINKEEARLQIEKMIQGTLNLNGEVPSGEGLIKENIPIRYEGVPYDEDGGIVQLPEDIGVYVYIVNKDEIPNGIIKIETESIKELPIVETTVIIRANIPIDTGAALGGKAVVHKTGVAQASLNLD